MTTAAAPIAARSKANHTATRSFRIGDDVWTAALNRAAREGQSLSELMRDFLSRYGTGQDDTASLLAQRDSQLEDARRVAAELCSTLDACS